MSVTREELRQLRDWFESAIQDLKRKIYGRDPDGLITISQIDPSTVEQLREKGNYYVRGERLPVSAMPRDNAYTSDVTAATSGSINANVRAATIIDEVIGARDVFANLGSRLATFLSSSSVISAINALESGTIDEERVEGLSGKVDATGVIAAINDSEEEEQIEAAKINMSTVPGVVDFNCPVFCLDATAPIGWAIADGSQYLSATYPVAATRYAAHGTPDPGYFCVPDMRGMVPVGFKSGDDNFGTLGDEVGSAEHTLTIDEMPSHDHNMAGSTNQPVSYMPPALVIPDAMGTHAIFQSVNTPIAGGTSATGGGEPHNNVQPSKVGNYIVRLI